MQNENIKTVDQTLIDIDDEYYMDLYLRSESRRSIAMCGCMLVALLISAVLAVVYKSLIPLSFMAGGVLGILIEHYIPLYDALKFVGRSMCYEDQ